MARNLRCIGTPTLSDGPHFTAKKFKDAVKMSIGLIGKRKGSRITLPFIVVTLE
jgi:hypothetical protein